MFDVSISHVLPLLLTYALSRFQRHHDTITIIDLNGAELSQSAFNVATAFDALIHVPDFDATAKRLRTTIKPGGWLFSNFDTKVRAMKRSLGISATVDLIVIA